MQSVTTSIGGKTFKPRLTILTTHEAPIICIVAKYQCFFLVCCCVSGGQSPSNKFPQNLSFSPRFLKRAYQGHTGTGINYSDKLFQRLQRVRNNLFPYVYAFRMQHSSKLLCFVRHFMYNSIWYMYNGTKSDIFRVFSVFFGQNSKMAKN